MRDKWYGDKRDIVKWGTIVILARRRSINVVLQVALYRPDKNMYHLTVDGTTEPLPSEVIRHFRNIDDIKRLGANVNLQIDIHKDLFQWPTERRAEFRTREDFRNAYFGDVSSKIKRYNEPMIVFLDPDTGLAPKNYGYEHVTPQNIQTVLRAMKDGDVLLFYQHAPLGDKNWLNYSKEAFGKAVGEDIPVDIIMCKEIAHDVVFFVVERSRWVDPVTNG